MDELHTATEVLLNWTPVLSPEWRLLFPQHLRVSPSDIFRFILHLMDLLFI